MKLALPLLALVALTSACSAGAPDPSPDAPTTTPPVVADARDSGLPDSDGAPGLQPPPEHVGDPMPTLPKGAVPAPPWAVAPLAADAVPDVYRREWERADNRARCAPLVLSGADAEPGITVRRATFSGGWAVAYDAPGQRSAFGIAGAGVSLSDGGDTYEFENSIDWSDGSRVSYGLEGGTGPGHAAYLRVAGQDCLYNLWSKRGQAHLEGLFASLRRLE
jgi:hypothetical protein